MSAVPLNHTAELNRLMCKAAKGLKVAIINIFHNNSGLHDCPCGWACS